MRIVIATTHVPFVDGGAEAMVRSLHKALEAAGHRVEVARIPFKWYPPERIHEHVLACRLLDLTEANGVPVDKVIGVKFPAYHVRHPDKVLWMMHQFRTAFEMWGSEHCDLSPHPHGKAVRDSIEAIERALLPEARALFTISATVSARLQSFCGQESAPLYQPPEHAEAFHAGPLGDYLYFPSRLNRWKRQMLALEALAHTRKPVRVRFSGAPDNPDYLAKLESRARALRVDGRAAFLGRVPFDEMVELYAGARGVLFTPEEEDYGYITLEAMLSSKPVITCRDSGGPTEFIRDGEEGFIADPAPEALARAMDALWDGDAFAREAGLKARRRYDELEISWDHVVRRLLQ